MTHFFCLLTKPVFTVAFAKNTLCLSSLDLTTPLSCQLLRRRRWAFPSEILSSNPTASLSGICLQVLLSSSAGRLSGQTASLGSPERTQTPDWHNKSHRRQRRRQTPGWAPKLVCDTESLHISSMWRNRKSINALTQGKVPVYTKPVYFWNQPFSDHFLNCVQKSSKKNVSEEMEPCARSSSGALRWLP